MSTSRPSSSALGAPRIRRPSRAVLLLLALLAVLLPAALAPAPARAEPPASVEVTDTTRSVDPEILEHRLAEIDFRTEVRLVVLVLDVTEHDLDPADDRALNDAVLDHARSSDPSLLSADGSHWADGTVILALDPENRFLGSYGGEDVKLTEEQFADVQDAMRDPARDGDWDGSLEAGAKKYASLLHRPWWRHPAALVAAAAVVVGAVVAAASTLGLRLAARRRVDRALPRHQDVLTKRAITDAAARTLPEHSAYAQAAVLAHERYSQDLEEAARLRAALPEPAERPWVWGLRGRERATATDFERVVERLDDADDDILAAADLLHRSGEWRAVWDRELEPLRDSLAALGEVEEDRGEMSTAEQASADRLLTLGDGIARELDRLTARLENDAIDPDSALEELDTLTRELSAAVEELAEHRIDVLAEDDDEREVLRDAFEDADGGEYRSLRARRHALTPGTSPGLWQLSPVLWYSSWHRESGSALETHRSPSSGGGGVTGYSGGGFSGAGSSSRF